MRAVTATTPPELAGASFRYPRLMRRIERLINLIAALLEAPLPMTADDIRSRIAGYDQDNREAFRRTFERDKEALRAMGIPIETTQVDPLGADAEGYIIPKTRYYLPQLDLEPDELAALRIAAEAILGAAEAAHAGLMKLTVDAETAPVDGPRIVWGADLASEQPLLASLYSALLDRRTVTFSYQAAGSDQPATRTVEPYGLLHRRGHWYVVGRDRDRDAIRAFKVSRIKAPVRATSGSYNVPEGFDANAHMSGEPWEVGGELTATAVVRFSAKLRWWADQNLPEAHRREAPRGALDVEMPVSNIDALVSWAIGFGEEIEIVEPDSARSALVARLGGFAEAAR
jgi:proteasome accessory factor B